MKLIFLTMDDETVSSSTSFGKRVFACSRCGYETNKMNVFRQHVAFSKTLCFDREKIINEDDIKAYDRKRAMIIHNEINEIITDHLFDVREVSQLDSLYMKVKKLATKLKIYINYDTDPYLTKDQYDEFITQILNAFDAHRSDLKK